MEKFEYFPMKCRKNRAADLRKSLYESNNLNGLVEAQSTPENKAKKPLKSKVYLACVYPLYRMVNYGLCSCSLSSTGHSWLDTHHNTMMLIQH